MPNGLNATAEYALLVCLLRVAELDRRARILAERILETENQITDARRDIDSIQSSLKGAQDAYFKARMQLEQSDIVRRRNDLQRRLDEAEQQAGEIERRWTTLRDDLQREASAFQTLLEANALEPAEAEKLRDLIAEAAALTDGQAPLERLPGLPGLIDETLPLLEEAFNRVKRGQVRINDQRDELLERGKILEEELESLRRTGKASYRREVERMRDLLAPLIGARPSLLCELLEIPDERWQDAVEAMLGARRFTIVPAPEHFDAALRILEEARAREQLYEAALLDLERASNEARQARPRSLALQVETANSGLRAYIDSILGDIITCDEVAQLRSHRRAVTPNVVYYGEWTVRAIRPESRYPKAIIPAEELLDERLKAIDEQTGGDSGFGDLIANAAGPKLLIRRRTTNSSS